MNDNSQSLDAFRERGGVTLADLDAPYKPVRMPDTTTIHPLIWAAAGTRDEQRELSEDERIRAARAIEASIAQHRSWATSRPATEQVALARQPVIYIGPADDDDVEGV